MKSSLKLRTRRKIRQRNKLSGILNNKPRIVVHRSNNHFYAQVISEEEGKVIAFSSTLVKGSKGMTQNGGNKEGASMVGRKIADELKKNGITRVVFDRSGFLYHGRVKAFADSARAHGLIF
jgi:large subunit ribosomal protein L18